MRGPLSRNAWSFNAEDPRLPVYRASSLLELQTTNAGRCRRVPQQVFDVVFPSAASHEIGTTANFPGLEKASRISFLESHGEASVPSVQECHLSPMARRSHVGIDLSHSVVRPPEPVLGLRTPTPQRLDDEGNQAPTR